VTLAEFATSAGEPVIGTKAELAKRIKQVCDKATAVEPLIFDEIMAAFKATVDREGFEVLSRVRSSASLSIRGVHDRRAP
jgi:hypothetical protein